jgi:hypothetical protein
MWTYSSAMSERMARQWVEGVMSSQSASAKSGQLLVVQLPFIL